MFLPDYGLLELGLVLRLGSTVGHSSNSWSSCYILCPIVNRENFVFLPARRYANTRRRQTASILSQGRIFPFQGEGWEQRNGMICTMHFGHSFLMTVNGTSDVCYNDGGPIGSHQRFFEWYHPRPLLFPFIGFTTPNQNSNRYYLRNG